MDCRRGKTIGLSVMEIAEGTISSALSNALNRLGNVGREDEPHERERAALLLHLIDVERVDLYDAEQWLRSWEAKADELGRPRGSHDFWTEGLRWIVGERNAKVRRDSS